MKSLIELRDQVQCIDRKRRKAKSNLRNPNQPYRNMNVESMKKMTYELKNNYLDKIKMDK